MDSPRLRAGHLILARALGLCLRRYHETGCRPQSWDAVRACLAETFPTASPQSREAVIRYAQKMVANAKADQKKPRTDGDRRAVDCHAVIRDRNRVR